MIKTFNYDESKFIPFEKVLELWEKNTYPLAVYLHNPFCFGRNCRFCVHKGCVNFSKKDVDWFYFEYMPAQFKKYENLIEKSDIKLLNFGGGTPNYLPADKFDKYFQSLPDKLRKPELHKFIELHVGYLKKDFLEMLAKNNFTMVTFCIQTFDNSVLDFYNRKGRDKNEIKELMDYAHSLGLKVAVDLIYGYYENPRKNMDLLQSDLKFLKECNPEEISIAPLYQYRYIKTESEQNSIIDNIRLAVSMNLPSYMQSQRDAVSCVTRVYKDAESQELFDECMNSLTSGTPWFVDNGVSTLGIGDYKSQIVNVHSGIGPYIGIHEVENEENPMEPRYYLAKNYNFWDMAHKTLDYLEKMADGVEVPVVAELTLRNVMINNQTFFSNFEDPGRLDFNFIARMDYKNGPEFISTLNKNVEKIDDKHNLMEGELFNLNMLIKDE